MTDQMARRVACMLLGTGLLVALPVHGDDPVPSQREVASPGPVLRAPTDGGAAVESANVPQPVFGGAVVRRERIPTVPIVRPASGAGSATNVIRPVSGIANSAVMPGLPGSQHPLSTDQMQELITKLVLENIPHEFEDRDDWDQTKRVVSGLDMKLDGLELKTKRRRKRVNHGSWKMFGARLIDPENRFDISIDRMVAPRPGEISFTATFTARLLAWARLQRWNLGAKLFSVSTEAAADVALEVDLLVAFDMDSSDFPPVIVMRPQATRANLDLKRFRVRRISHVKGDLAKELGNASRGVIEKQIRRKREKLVSRINKSIQKNEDKFRLSFADLLSSRWGKSVKPLIPAESEKAE